MPSLPRVISRDSKFISPAIWSPAAIRRSSLANADAENLFDLDSFGVRGDSGKFKHAMARVEVTELCRGRAFRESN